MISFSFLCTGYFSTGQLQTQVRDKIYCAPLASLGPTAVAELGLQYFSHEYSSCVTLLISLLWVMRSNCHFLVHHKICF